MSIISDLFLSKKERREKALREKKALLTKEYTDRYQIMEYNGREYLSVNGKPTIESELLRNDLVDAIKAAREATIGYLMER